MLHCTGKQAWYDSRGLENRDTGCGVNRQGVTGKKGRTSDLETPKAINNSPVVH